MRVDFGLDNRTLNQMDIVLQRFKNGEHLSSLSCLSDGVCPTSFNRIYKYLKDGNTPDGSRYVFDEYWSNTHDSGKRKRGAYKLRVLLGVMRGGIEERFNQIEICF